MKSIKITDPALLEKCKQFKKAQENFTKATNAELAKYNATVNGMVAEYRKNARKFFREITEQFIEDPDEAFTKQTHSLNLYFLDFGDAFLVEIAKPDGTPLDEYEGEGEDDEDEDDDDEDGPIIIN